MKKILAIIMALALTLPTTVRAAVPEEAKLEQEKAKAVIDTAANMEFPADESDVQLPCPICGETVTWLAWGMESEINTRDNRFLVNRHLYLTTDFTGTEIDDPKSNAWGWVFRTNNANTHSVIHLNGKTLKASQGGIASFHGEVNVIGDGFVWGNRNNAVYGGNLDAGKDAVLNIYGGTYYKTSPQPLLQVNGGICNLYGGKLEGNDAKPEGTVAVEAGGKFFVYGGTVESGYLSKDGDTILVDETATAGIYGGSVIGGKDNAGGNIYVGGNLEIGGGNVMGAIKVGTGALSITGGELDSVVVGEAERITITGGRFSSDISRFVAADVRVKEAKGWYTVGAEAGGELLWLWLVLVGAVVLAVVLVPVLVLSAKKKKDAANES